MNRQELETAARKAILENQHNPAAPAVVQVWNNRELPVTFLATISHKYLGHRLNKAIGHKQHVYVLDAREVLRQCEEK